MKAWQRVAISPLSIKTSAGALTNLLSPGKVVPRTWDVALKATKRTSPALPCGALNMASHFILVGAPSQRHVPYFAMPVPRSRENYYERDAAPVGFRGVPRASGSS